MWNRLETAFPDDRRVNEKIAQTLAEEGQLEAALNHYRKLAALKDSNGEHRRIGYRVEAAELKRKLGRSDEARSDFEAILQRLRPASWLYEDVRRRIEAGFVRSGDYPDSPSTTGSSCRRTRMILI